MLSILYPMFGKLAIDSLRIRISLEFIYLVNHAGFIFYKQSDPIKLENTWTISLFPGNVSPYSLNSVTLVYSTTFNNTVEKTAVIARSWTCLPEESPLFLKHFLVAYTFGS